MEVLGRVRRLIGEPKFYTDPAQSWSIDPAPSRYTPFTRSMRLPSVDWTWRALRCASTGNDYVLLCRVNMRVGNYQAWLLMEVAGGLTLMSRLEDHGSHPGLHIHSACGDEIPEAGTDSIRSAPTGQKLFKVPNRGGRRTVQGETLSLFWNTACKIYRISPRNTSQGELEV